jgi:hypothetical protein
VAKEEKREEKKRWCRKLEEVLIVVELGRLVREGPGDVKIINYLGTRLVNAKL